jgi:hypothetical protein
MNTQTNYPDLPTTLKISQLDPDTFAILVTAGPAQVFAELLAPVLDIVRTSVRGSAALFDSGDTVAPAIVLRPRCRGSLRDLVQALADEGYDLVGADGAELAPADVDPKS